MWQWAAIIAVIMVALGGWYFFHSGGQTGTDAMRAVAGQLALIWAVILVILNCRLEAWLETIRGMSPLPMPRWVIPLPTLALVLWFGIWMAVTKPRRTV